MSLPPQPTTQHSLGSCTSWPNNKREEPSSRPQDLHSQGSYYKANTKNPGLPQGISANTNTSLPYRDYRYNQNRCGHQQTSFDKWYNRQYSPNHNYQLYTLSPPVSVAGPDLSDTLIDLANHQSRSLDIMVANQKCQQNVYHEMTRASKDKTNDANSSL